MKNCPHDETDERMANGKPYLVCKECGDVFNKIEDIECPKKISKKEPPRR